MDMEADEAALARAKELGYQKAPVVLVMRDGVLQDHWADFRPDKIDALVA